MSGLKVGVSFAYQSRDISFSDWISLITLCLAPLIAHLISGVPTPTYTCGTRPRWHDRITHYNPTSILWRYFAITDRRLRTISWSRSDLAATNALFWTTNGWNGGEEMAQRCRTHIVRGSSRPHVDILSASTFKTIVVTLQGIQAIYVIASSVSGSYGHFGEYLALDTIFFPLAVFGLLRLPAALWLSDETLYRSNDPASDTFKPMETPLRDCVQTESEMLDLSQESIMSRYRSPYCWRGLTVRVFWIVIIAGLLTATVLQIPRRSTGVLFSLTGFAVLIFYLLFLSTTLVVLAFYIIRGSTSTIVPCISQRWYKVYTSILFLFMFAVFIIAALGTRRTTCGRSTVWPPGYDYVLCPFTVSVSASPANNVYSGLLSKTDNGTLVVGMFDGWCRGMSRWSDVSLADSGIFKQSV
jgi:hypothetical protein